MKFNGRASKVFVNFLRFVVVTLVVLVLLFVIKWRMNHLFSMMTPEESKDTTITEEIQTSKEQIGKISDAAKDASEKTTLLKIETTDPDSVAKHLKEAGLINDTTAFSNMTRRSGMARYITAGSYEIPEGATAETILKMLTENGLQKATRTVKIEIPQGATDEIICDIVLKEDLIADRATFLQMIRDAGAVPSIKPGGYVIHAPITATELLNTLTKYGDQANQNPPAPQEQQ
ncbi:endolytic transglycosylase MltG [Aedoeadaptatus pacaensis]|uniref:endolytic transglycosylase MltG n=1 Tax=Aedoeadaptatus pacaensis TaxID=1776390 RepID=UPI0008392EFE|nr:endolytic transglycosylase MltG [Peptoniphilus pacaensis]